MSFSSLSQDPRSRYSLTLDFSDVTSVIIHKHEQPATPKDIALACFVCNHQKFPDGMPAADIVRWLRTPLGALIGGWLLGRSDRGRPGGDRCPWTPEELQHQVEQAIAKVRRSDNLSNDRIWLEMGYRKDSITLVRWCQHRGINLEALKNKKRRGN